MQDTYGYTRVCTAPPTGTGPQAHEGTQKKMSTNVPHRRKKTAEGVQAIRAQMSLTCSDSSWATQRACSCSCAVLTIIWKDKTDARRLPAVVYRMDVINFS